jgi:hypothetical protein
VLLGLRLAAARVREVAREADLCVRLDQETRNAEAREAFYFSSSLFETLFS